MENIFIFGHKNPDTDSICASLVSEKLNKKNGWDCTVAKRLGNINKETQYVLDYLNIDAPEMIEKVEEGQGVILVDHNEFNQSVEGIEKAKIWSVVDHHRIANFQTSEPLYYNAKPYGCTCTILFEEYKRLGHKIEKEEAILMASAIISDTLLLKSPTTTEHDKNALTELEKIAEIDIHQYGLDMLKAGTDLSSYSASELINIDSKVIGLDTGKIIIAQVNTVDIQAVFANQKEIEIEIQKEIEKNDLDLFLFLVTDILNCNSKCIALGKKASAIEKAFNVTLENNTAILEGVVSRKKQVIPVVSEYL